MHVVVTLSSAEAQPWMDLLAAALPGARVIRREPGQPVQGTEPPADYVVLAEPCRTVFDAQPAPKAVFTASAGVGHLLRSAGDAGLTNLKVIQHDAVEVLQQQVPVESLDSILVLFPDPWHKKRHNKRRLVSGDFAALAASRLRRGGTLQLATDWEPYAEAMLEVLNGAAVLRNRATDRRFVPRNPGRILTRFEKRGERLGHAVHDLCFEKL